MRIIAVKNDATNSEGIPKVSKTRKPSRYFYRKGFFKNGGYLLSHCYAVPSA
jgi:hypothetical protein